MTKNSAVLVGFVGREPRFIEKSGSLRATVALATRDRWTEGECAKEQTNWHAVALEGDLAKIVRDHVRLGSAIFVSGPIVSREYLDATGWHKDWEIRATEVFVLDPRSLAGEDKPRLPPAPGES
jgi:single-stranded DNA-binding protein